MRPIQIRTSPAAVRRRLIVEWFLVAALVTAAVSALIVTGSLRRLDNIAYDQLQRLPDRPDDPGILIVEIDDRSLGDYGVWPWPRSVHATLIDRLAAAHPKAIAYDVVFAEPSADPAADKALARAVGEAGNLYLPLTDLAAGGGADPVRAINTAAAGAGLVHVRTDTDGLVRRTYAFETLNGRLVPDLMGVVDRATRPQKAARHMPDPRTALLIPFSSRAGRFRTVAFSSVLAGEVPNELIRDKVVLVGVTATGVGERFATPTTGEQSSLSGVELQANILEGLRTGTMVRPAGLALTLVFAILPAWLMLLAFGFLTPRWTLAAGVALGAFISGLSALLLFAGHLWLSPAGAVVGLLILAPLWGWRRLATVSDYLGRELQRLGSFTGTVGVDAAVPGADVITRQALSLGTAITKIEEMRRFASDALFSLPDATLVIDADGRVVAVNGAAQALFEAAGCSPIETLPAGVVMNALGAVGQRFAGDWPAGQALDKGMSLDLADGRAFELQVVDRLAEGGGRVAWIIRLADVTAMKSAVRQREQAIQLLTHDMRSPQISILALIETAGDGAISDELADRIVSYSKRTLDLADGFVHLARAEDTTARREVIDICDVANEAVDELWPQIQKRKVEVRQTDCDTPRYVLGERQILTRALVNLISNAIKYGPEGGGIDVYVYGRERGGQAMVGVAVKDEGQGMTQEEAATAFDAFRRFERAHPSDGVGLGLAFVKAAAQRHGGVAACDSAPGQGATFTFELPEYLEG